MRLLIGLTLCVLLFGSWGQDAHGQTASVSETRATVLEMAFDPALYFPSRYVADSSMIKITYTGDDYGWPVYAIAVAEGCVDREDVQRDNCTSRLRARMVRAPAPAGLTRPRQRGSYLIGEIVAKSAVSADQIRTALTEINPEWVEADLRICPGAMDALKRSSEAVWVPEAVAEPDSDAGNVEIVLHADIIEVELRQYARRASYRGWIAEDSPAAWAESLAAVLEPCWRPASVTAPWFKDGQ